LDWRFDGLTALVSIAAGKAGDLGVLAGNRAKNIDDVERVETVFKDGVGYDPAKLMRSVEGLPLEGRDETKHEVFITRLYTGQDGQTRRKD
jgi:hypothetical protein